MNYFEWSKVLSDIYFEDSYVLGIREYSSDIDFEMDFVLRESHPLYQTPKSGESYCYRRGILRLSTCTDVQLDRAPTVNLDANCEMDLGNIDTFSRDGDRISMSGDWGTLSLSAEKVMVFVAL